MKIRASQIGKYIDCHHRERMRYYSAGRGSDHKYTRISTFVGSLAHAKLEALFKNEPERNVQGADFYQFDSITPRLEIAHQQAKQIARTVFEKLQKFKDFNWRSEVTLFCQTQGVRLEGTVDFLSTAGILDLKTGVSPLTSGYQLGAYLILARANGFIDSLDDSIVAVVHAPRKKINEKLDVKLYYFSATALVKQCETAIESIVKMEKIHPANPQSKFCGVCEYFQTDDCPATKNIKM